MGTTGAPWNIPFVDPSDLVRDFPTDDEAQALAIAAGLSAAGNPGIGSNVVQAEATSAFTTTSDTFVTLTGVTFSFTPSSNTSKVLLVATAISSSDAVPRGGEMAIFRGGTQVSQISIQTADSAGNDRQGALAVIYLDSPASGTAQTYDLRVRRHNAFGTTRFDWGNLTAIEVAV